MFNNASGEDNTGEEEILTQPLIMTIPPNQVLLTI